MGNSETVLTPHRTDFQTVAQTRRRPQHTTVALLNGVQVKVLGGKGSWQQEYWTGECHTTVPDFSKGTLIKRDTTAL